MASAHDPTISSSGAVVFSQFFWPAALQQLAGLLAGWYLGADGDGALCCSDPSTARRLDGGAS
jgi:hypothetical protein